MNKQLSEKSANVYVGIIGIFYLISGIWEFIHIMQGESMMYFLVNIYHIYVAYLGLLTFLVGIGILLKINFARKLALILAWWNLFTVPLLEIWWIIYKIGIKKTSKIESLSALYTLVIGTTIIIILVTIVRIYIIHILGKIKYNSQEGAIDSLS